MLRFQRKGSGTYRALAMIRIGLTTSGNRDPTATRRLEDALLQSAVPSCFKNMYGFVVDGKLVN